MNIVVAKDYFELSKNASEIVINQVQRNPQSVLALPTGDTPLQMYRELVLAYKSGDVDFSSVSTFNLDEYLGFSNDQWGSYSFYMNNYFFSKVNIPPESTHLPDGHAKNIKAECRRYDNLIKALGEIDLAVLGIGMNGHIGFNEPGTSFNEKTHLTKLSKKTIEQNSIHFRNICKMPTRAITMGLGTITCAKKIILLATGPHKAKAVNELVNGPVTMRLPASILQPHDDVTLFLDEAAAYELRMSGGTDHKQKDFTIYEERNLPRGKRIITVSPHPDDSVIAAGGTLTMLAKNNDLTSLVMTSGYRAWIPDKTQEERIRIRTNEAMREAKTIGCDIRFLNMDFYENQKISSGDLQVFLKILKELKPEIVFTAPTEDQHPTHKLSTEVVFRSLQKYIGKRQPFVEVWQYETPWSLFALGAFNVLVQIPEKAHKRKLAAIRKHRSQLKRTPYDKVSEALSLLRSSVVGEQILGQYGKIPPNISPYAEVFSLSRKTRSLGLVESLSGIRGRFGIDLTPEMAEDYGFSYGTWLKKKLDLNPKVVVGMDTRPSGPILMKALVRGLEKAHCHIFNIGIGTTPLIQFEVRNRVSHGGVIITASHNEPEWNGFKFLWKDGGILKSEYMDEVINFYRNQSKPRERPFSVHYVSFIDKILGKSAINKIRASGLKIVVDPNGGAMIVLIKKIFEHLGIKTFELNMAPGVFKHKVEPDRDALRHMGPYIRKTGADLGVAWDCDGDRIEIVLPGGKLLSGHYVLALLIKEVFSKKVKHKIVVVSNATSRVVRDVAAVYGAKLIETDVGEINVVEEIYRQKAPVGGEGTSGGGIIPPSRCRDGVLTLVKILSLTVRERKPIAKLLSEFPYYSTLQKNIHLERGAEEAFKDRILAFYSKRRIRRFGSSRGAIKVHLPGKAFVLCRSSRTEPNLIRIIVDSPSLSQSKNIMQEILRLI